MLHEIALARQSEFFLNPLRISHRIELEQVQKLDRLQRSVRVVRARLGLNPATAK